MPVITGISGGSLGATVQFVDSISTTAVVRFDFHDLEPSMVTEIDVSPPQLRYAKSSTMLVDGDHIHESAYANRVIKITAEFQADTADVTASALSALALELNRPTNILRVQVGSVPTFYRTYRSSFTSQMVAYDANYLKNGVEIEAEPFGLGLPQIVASQNASSPVFDTTRIASDPGVAPTGDAMANRLMDIPNVLGDVETPPQILLSSSFTPLGSYGSVVLAVRRGGTPSNLQATFQAESWTAGFDTALSSSHDAAFSGGGNNYLHCTFATQTTLTHRMGFLWPPAATVEARGSFRLYARVRGNGGGVGLTLAAEYNGVQLQPAVNVTPDGNPRLLDLGTFTSPAGADPVFNGFSGVEVPIQPGQMWLSAGRPSGSATLDFDYVLAIPADDRLAIIDVDPTVLANTFSIFDATSDTDYQSTTNLTDSAGLSLSPAMHSRSGSLPMLSPGSANRLYVLAPVNHPDTLDLFTAFYMYVDVQIRYWPRYLTLATV